MPDSGEIGTPGYKRIEGWRITPHELGPHPQAESCDEPPVCGYVYRLAALIGTEGAPDGD